MPLYGIEAYKVYLIFISTTSSVQDKALSSHHITQSSKLSQSCHSNSSILSHCFRSNKDGTQNKYLPQPSATVSPVWQYSNETYSYLIGTHSKRLVI